MSQSTLDDDDLFGEAATEMRSDVEEHLEAARDALPDPDAIWDVEADNTLGALNALRSSLDPGEAETHLRDARKWYTMGERADAFEDAGDLEAELEDVGELIAELTDAREQVSDLAGTVPEIRSELESAGENASDDEGDE